MGNIIFEILFGHDYTIKNKKTVKYYKNKNYKIFDTLEQAN
jgi:hypothetical protein